MESGYEIIWTDNALEELASTYQYLESNFPEKVLFNLSHEIEKVSYLISRNPHLFAESEEKKGIRKAVIEKYNTMYYRISAEAFAIEILSFYSNRQDPNKNKL